MFYHWLASVGPSIFLFYILSNPIYICCIQYIYMKTLKRARIYAPPTIYVDKVKYILYCLSHTIINIYIQYVHPVCTISRKYIKKKRKNNKKKIVVCVYNISFSCFSYFILVLFFYFLLFVFYYFLMKKKNEKIFSGNIGFFMKNNIFHFFFIFFFFFFTFTY